MSGFARWTSVSIRELARILRATLAGVSVMPSPRLTGTRDQETNQEQNKIQSRAGRDESRPYEGAPVLLLLLLRARCALLWLLRVPITLRRQRTKRPAGCARGIARIPLLHRMCSQRNPADDADPLGRMPKGRNVLGRVLFGDFLLHEQEKVTRSPVGRVEARAFQKPARSNA